MTEAVEPHPTRDRTGWGPGPWDGEPDELRFDHLGFPCLVTRQDVGYLCGYLAVPPGHPWHGKRWDDVSADAHGGITYADECSGHVCHVPKPGEPANVWWVGFDCSHHGDAEPGRAVLRAILGDGPDVYGFGGVYRDLAYVRAQLVALAEQAAAAAVAP